ncbi:hypothetical protein ACP275_04G137900 [Erythranthe tilingii]
MGRIGKADDSTSSHQHQQGVEFEEFQHHNNNEDEEDLYAPPPPTIITNEKSKLPPSTGKTEAFPPPAEQFPPVHHDDEDHHSHFSSSAPQPFPPLHHHHDDDVHQFSPPHQFPPPPEIFDINNNYHHHQPESVDPFYSEQQPPPPFSVVQPVPGGGTIPVPGASPTHAFGTSPAPPVFTPPIPDHEWKTHLFDCMSDPQNAIITLCFPCVTFGQIAEILDAGRTSCGTSGMLYVLITCIAMPCLMSCSYRTKMRAKFGLIESPAPDCLIHCFCGYCALCQEYRELEKRGIDPSIGYYGNVAKMRRQQEQMGMAAPMPQKMI